MLTVNSSILILRKIKREKFLQKKNDSLKQIKKKDFKKNLI